MDFIGAEQPKTIGFFSESCKVIFEDINRAFLFFRNAEINSIMDQKFVNTVKIEKGKDTWTVGNIYSGNWVGISPFRAEVLKYIDEKHLKLVRWKINFKIGISFIKSIYLYDITDLGATVVLIRMEELTTGDRITGEEDKNFYKNLYDNFLLKAANFLKTYGGKYMNYESGLIKQNQKIIWEYLTNMNKANCIEKVMADYFEYRGEILSQGSFIKGINPINGVKNQPFYLRVADVQNDPNSNEWKYKLETFGVNCCYPKQEIILNVVFIKSNITHVGYFHLFKEHIKRSSLKKLGDDKKSFLIKAKNYFEKL